LEAIGKYAGRADFERLLLDRAVGKGKSAYVATVVLRVGQKSRRQFQLLIQYNPESRSVTSVTKFTKEQEVPVSFKNELGPRSQAHFNSNPLVGNRLPPPDRSFPEHSHQQIRLRPAEIPNTPESHTAYGPTLMLPIPQRSNPYPPRPAAMLTQEQVDQQTYHVPGYPIFTIGPDGRPIPVSELSGGACNRFQDPRYAVRQLRICRKLSITDARFHFGKTLTKGHLFFMVPISEGHLIVVYFWKTLTKGHLFLMVPQPEGHLIAM